jgi:hypothetical protein
MRAEGDGSARSCILLVLAVVAAAMGCGGDASIGKRGMLPEDRPYGYGARCRAELLGRIGNPSTVTCGGVTVYFPERFAPQAASVAAKTAKLFSHITAVTGFRPVYDLVNVYLAPVEGGDDGGTLDTGCFIESRETFGQPLYVKNGEESWEAILVRNQQFPHSLVHEVVEWSLIDPRRKAPVPTDTMSGAPGGRPRYDVRYTRWFREGLAEYASHLACQALVCDKDWHTGEFPKATHNGAMAPNPFSSLSRVGTDLFKWHQFTEQPAPVERIPGLVPVGKRWGDYYAAAEGLFLVIEDRFGQEAIRRIVEGLETLERAEGEDLIRLVNETLRTDVVQLVSEYRFPETGLRTTECYWPPGDVGPMEGLSVKVVSKESPAEKAGIREGDVILSVDEEPTVTNRDFERAIYERTQKQSVRIGLWRRGLGKTAVDLKLQD